MTQKQKIVVGDIVSLIKTGRYDVVIHGCNCQCVMRAGVAWAITEAFPEVYRADMETRPIGAHLKIGTISVASVSVPERERPTYVINAYTQITYGRNPQHRYVSYDAVADSLKLVADRFGNSGLRFLYPKIGGGLGGGEWGIVEAIIDYRLGDEDRTLVVLDGDK